MKQCLAFSMFFIDDTLRINRKIIVHQKFVNTFQRKDYLLHNYTRLSCSKTEVSIIYSMDIFKQLLPFFDFVHDLACFLQ